MKKNIIKPIVMSALSALAFGAVGTAGTFALFTDKTETSVQVQAGKVDVESSLSDLAFYELGVTSPIQTETTDGAKINSIGGTAKIVGSSLVLNKWVPGDKVTFKLTTKNKSNVEILTKLRVNHTSTSSVDLFEALNISYERESGIAQNELFHWSSVHVSNNMDTGETISVINVTIEFPNRSNEITARNEGIDNHYQESNCTIVFTQQAVQGNASTVDLVSKWNEILGSTTSPENNDSLTAALGEIEEATEALLKSERIVWNAENDQFCYEEEVPLGQEYKYFKAFDNMPFIQNWSVYASGDWTGGNTVNLKGIGFDAGGAASSITTVSYVGEAAERTNRIYTNSASTNITINAPQDTVKHYGVAGTLDIIAVAGSSYHEYGKIAFASIAKGRIALESTSKVSQIHVEKKTESTFDDIIIAKASTVDLPKLSRDDVDIDDDGTLVVALQDGTGTVQQNELDYVWLTKQGIYEQIKVSNSDESAGSVWADDESNSQTTKDAAQQIANNIVDQIEIVDKTYNVSVDSSTREIVLTNANDSTDVASQDTVAAKLNDIVEEKGLDENKKDDAVKEQVAIVAIEENPNYVARIGTTGYATLSAAWNAGANKTIILLKDLTQNALQCYQNNELDLNGHTLILRGHPDAGTTGGAIFIDGGRNWGHGNLTIKNGTLNMTGAGFSTYGIYNYGTLNLRDLVINSSVDTAIYVNGQDGGSTGVTTLDHVTLNSTNTSGTALAAHSLYVSLWYGTYTYKPTVNVSDSTIVSAYDGVAIHACDANIKDSTITASNNALWNTFSANGSGLTGIVNLRGSININATSDYRRVNAEDGNSIVANPGTYNFDPSNYCATGYRAKKLSETSWQVVEICQTHQFGAATEIDEIHHKRVCTICGYEEISLHEYEDACGECTVCHHGGESDTAHAANKVTVAHGNVVEYYDEIHKFFEDFNKAANTNNEAYTLTFGPGIYHLPVNTYLIEENPLYPQRTLRITGTRSNDLNNEYLTVLMPEYGNHFTNNEGNNSGLFCVSGLSTFNDLNGGVTVDNLFFDIPAYPWTSQNYNKDARFFAVYCLTGGSGQEDKIFPETTEEGKGYHRYAHNVLVEYCEFVGPGGKFAGVVGANNGNCQPSCITIQHCVGEKMNCWFNGYAIDDIKDHPEAWGVKIIDCDSSEFLVVANLMSTKSSIYVDDVDGTFLYNDPTVDNSNKLLAANATDSLDGTENWILQAYKETTVTVSNCDWTMLARVKNSSGVFINGQAASITLTVTSSTFTARSDNSWDVYLARNAGNAYSTYKATNANPSFTIA